jgi:uncharacterized protein YbjT (DUF2867 family)
MQTSVSALKGDIFLLPFALERRQSFVDLADVAEVVAKIAAEQEVHWGATYELSSEDCLTAHEVAAAMTRILQRPLRATQTDVEQFLREYLVNVPADRIPYQRKALAGLCGWYNRHDFVGNANVLAMLLGRRPVRYAAFAERTFARARRE